MDAHDERKVRSIRPRRETDPAAPAVLPLHALQAELRSRLQVMTQHPPQTLRSGRTQADIEAIAENVHDAMAELVRSFVAGLAPGLVNDLLVHFDLYDALNDSETVLPPHVALAAAQMRDQIEAVRLASVPSVPTVLMTPVLGDSRFESRAAISVGFVISDPADLASFADAVARFPDEIDLICSLAGLRPRVDGALPHEVQREPSRHVADLLQQARSRAGDPGRAPPVLQFVNDDAGELWEAGLASLALLDFQRQWRRRTPRPDRRLRAVAEVLLHARSERGSDAHRTVSTLSVG